MSTSVLLAILLAAMTVFTMGAGADAVRPQTKVDINRADLDQLTTLPGIGPSRAEAIVNYRLEHGPFSSVDDLAAVKGVGEGLLQKIRPLVTVNQP
ncbi:MAG: ComEA family DNA-binding protein [bacterium]|nr:MAG: ComEA family DNA-binding protein [bacterium]